MSNNKLLKKVEGSMPCGNPKRFDSRDVVRMPQEGNANNKRKADRTDSAESQSEKHLRLLLKHQMKKDITFTEQFSQHRSFTPATSHDPDSEKLVGVHNFEQYKQVINLDSRIDYLRHCGLTDEEVTLYLQEEMKTEFSKGFGAHPESKSKKLQEIEKKMKDKEQSLSIPDNFQGALEMSRQERDLERSIQQKFGKMSDIPSIIINRKLVDTHPDDPINHIPDILNNVIKKTEREPRRERRRKRKQERRKLFYDSLNVGAEVCSEGHSSDDQIQLAQPSTALEQEPLAITNSAVHESNISTVTADNIEDSSNCVTLLSSHSQIEPVLKSTESCNKSTIKEITGSIKFLSKEEIMSNKLTLDEIKAMEKFKNYTIGEPNKVVYVKNIHPKVSDEDLAALFGGLQSQDKPHIIFKRLTGKMKGQAFITFPDNCSAGEAIQLINGYKFKDKPIILCYGKKNS